MRILATRRPTSAVTVHAIWGCRVEFRLLGRFEVEHEGRLLAVGRRRERCLLGVLLLEANTASSVERLVDLLWDAEPPSDPKAAIHTFVSRLRSGLDPDGDGRLGIRLLRSGGGYLAEADPAAVDALVFRDLVEQARGIADPARSAGMLRRALALWRGPLLADAASERLRERLGAPWQELGLLARESAVEAELACGRHRELVAELTVLNTDHPLREKFAGLLMLALYRSGRQADALELYARTDRRLRDDLGIEPGTELRELHRRMLCADPGLAAGPVESAPPRREAVPRQLPAAVRHFTGRIGELKTLVELVGEVGETGGTVVISAIDGMAGVGKTALAVHAGHRLAEHFPDGQLFIDLHGYTEGTEPRDPADALAAVLQGLGVPPQRIPADPQARASLYRDRLADTRTLILLDNAASEAQVRPLLPGAGRCLVLITSRRRLKALDDAHALPLDVLPLADAVALFREAAGDGRTIAGDPLLEKVAVLCGCLPLALRIAAALIRHRPAWSMEHLLEKLRAARPELTSFAAGDRDLGSVFDLSLQALAGDRRLLFRRLGLVPGPDIDDYAAAALLEAAPAETDRLLQDLVDHNLLSEPVPGRYRMHDLIRAHARALAEADPGAARDAALGRLLDYYQHTSAVADTRVARYQRPEPVGRAPAHAPDLADPERAVAWLRAEAGNLAACFGFTVERGCDTRTVALAAGMANLHLIDGPWQPALVVHGIAVEAAERLGDHAALARALNDAGAIRVHTGEYEAARRELGQALALYREVGDRHGESGVLIELATIKRLQGESADALGDLVPALELQRASGDRTGQAFTLIELGVARYLASDRHGAIDALEQAVALHREIGNRQGRANALIYLGGVRSMDGDYETVIRDLEEALRLQRELGNRHFEATALGELGGARRLVGDYQGAIRDLELALEIRRTESDRLGEATIMTSLGKVRLHSGDHPGAMRDLETALEQYHGLGARGNEVWVLNIYGATLRAAGDAQRSEAAHAEALEGARALRIPDEEALALEGIGESRLQRGDVPGGVALLQEALETFRRLRISDADRIAARLEAIGADAGAGLDADAGARRTEGEGGNEVERDGGSSAAEHGRSDDSG
ncbi:MAG TPA: BTAD domain-containing putative transcriptional regulator [Actinocrinis sp.]